MSLILLFGNQGAASVDATVTWLAFDTDAPAATGVTGTLSATESGSDTALISGQVLVQGTASATETGADTAALAGLVVVQGSAAAIESGADALAATGFVLVQGSLSATEVGSDTAAINGSSAVTTTGTLDAVETGSDTAAISGAVLVQGSAAASETGSDTAALAGAVIVQGTLAATETGSDTAAIQGGAPAAIVGLLAATESGADTASASGRVLVQGSLAAQEVGSDTASIGSEPEIVSQHGFVLVDFEPASWWKRKPKAMPERVARAKLKKATRVIAEVVAQPLPVAQQEQAIRQAIAPMLPEMPGFDWRGIFRELIAQENARQQMQALIQRARDADDEDVILLAFF